MHAPHCTAPCARKADWSGSSRPSRSSPSTVVTSRSATCATGTRQAQTACPSSWTVQAPQSPASHPTFVPVSARSSRRTSESRRIGGVATVTARPLTRNAMGRPASAGPLIGRVAREGAGRSSAQRPRGSRPSRGDRRSGRGPRGRPDQARPRSLRRRAGRGVAPRALTRRRATGEHAPTASRASAIRPSRSRTSTPAAITIEMTSEVRAPTFSNALRASPSGIGTCSPVMSSSGARSVWRLPLTNSLTATRRRPRTEASSTRASSVISVGRPSAAGEAFATLPTIVPRFWIWMPPIVAAASLSPSNNGGSDASAQVRPRRRRRESTSRDRRHRASRGRSRSRRRGCPRPTGDRHGRGSGRWRRR